MFSALLQPDSHLHQGTSATSARMVLAATRSPGASHPMGGPTLGGFVGSQPSSSTGSGEAMQIEVTGRGPAAALCEVIGC